MIRRVVILSLVSTIAGACSQTSPPPASAPVAGPQASPAATPGSGAPAARAPEPSTPPEPPAPKFREVMIPEGTSLSVSVTTAVASDSSKLEDPVRGTLAKPIVVSGSTVVPTGSVLTGSVIEATQSARVKGRAAIAFRFDRLTIRAETHEIQTASVRREAAATKGKDAKKIGIGAGVGAVIGGVAGGGSGAAIGAAVGGGAGTAAVLATRGSEVEVPAGTTVTTRLQKPLTILVPVTSRDQ